MYNEEEWLRLLFLLSDTQQWITEMKKDIFSQLPQANKKYLFRKTYYLTASAFAHIIERHYYKIQRHPGSSKFTVPVVDILYWLKEGFNHPTQPMPCSPLLLRQFDTGMSIGNDKLGYCTSVITILTDPCGQIRTAFPGTCYEYRIAERIIVT